MSSFAKAATRAELPAGSKKVVEIDGRAIAVFNIGGVLYAIDDVCTHDGGPLADGELNGCEIECPRHGARFDVRTGRPLCMPAIEPVAVHKIELRGDDIYVALDD
jgi:3-phenylpropionate/trans-cinnamate dioxygenase ferredoxin subunit